jgi:hypothetical protein
VWLRVPRRGGGGLPDLPLLRAEAPPRGGGGGRTRGPDPDARLRFAFDVSDLGSEGSPASIRIPASRALDTTGLDAGEVLTQRKHATGLVEAPLGAGLARTPGEALSLLKLRQGAESVGAETPRPRIVLLPFRPSGERVTEPVSGVAFWSMALRPALGP